MKVILTSGWAWRINPLLAAIGIFIDLTTGAQPWLGEGLLTAEWLWTALFLVGPAIAGMCAIDGGLLFSRRKHAALGAAPLRGGSILRWALVTIGTTTLPFAIALVWMLLGVSYVNSEVIVPMILTACFGVLTIAVVCVAGLGLGSAWGMSIGCISAVLVFLGLGIFQVGSNFPVLLVRGSSASLSGITRTDLSLVIQALVLVVVFVAIYVAVAALPARGKWRIATIVGAACLVTLLAVGSLPLKTYKRIELTAADYTCVSHPEQKFEVCTTMEHSRLGGEVDLLYGQILAKARAAGIENLPAKMQETTPGSVQMEQGVGSFTLSKEMLDVSGKRIQPNTEWLISETVQPTWCAGLFAPEPPDDAYWSAVDEAQDSLTRVLLKNGTAADVERFKKNWHKISRCVGAEG